MIHSTTSTSRATSTAVWFTITCRHRHINTSYPFKKQVVIACRRSSRRRFQNVMTSCGLQSS